MLIAPRRRKRDDDDGERELTLEDINIVGRTNVLPIHLLFECVTGNALFHARGIYEVELDSFQSVDKQMISIQLAKLKIFLLKITVKKEFKPIETIMLDLIEGPYELVVGGYRMLEE
ncbi:hypothetical protein POM88_043730 [Heracleum sosnowskyi]|uniref:Uncharacterized protein n=1 Tax=Heracleum sosnowskyi TaxID=360622 RepID=A0AAD8H2H1_9APIA|nr:hypothetical protein POM88_043730 [Heracleum sosnowskyi]